MKSMLDIVKGLTTNPGPSGLEDSLYDEIKKIIKGCNVEISIDKLGNIVVFRKGDERGSIAFFAHNDEIGLIVTKIDGAYLRFTEIGGYDEKVLLGQEVIVYGKKKCSGIIGAKPPHLQTPGESDKLLRYSDLYVDLCMTQEELKKNIRIGDRILIKSDFTELKNGQISVKALDNRSCGAILLHSLRFFDKMKGIPDIYIVLNSQEETTMLGAVSSTHKINPDIAVVLDVTFAKQPGCDFGLPIDSIGIGKGAHICSRMFDFVKKLAEDECIKFVIEPLPSNSGTDAEGVQTARSGITTILLSLPIKNMHSPTEIANIKTMENMSKFLSRIVSAIKIADFKERVIK